MITVHAAGVAFAVGGIAVKQEFLSKFDQFFHALVATGKQSFTGPVAVNHRAGPAAETAVPATGRAGVDLDGAFAVRGAGIELVEGTVVTTPRVGFLEQVRPNVLRGEEFDGIGHPHAGQVRVPVQPIARFATRHRLSAGGAFGAARAEVQYGLSPMADALLHKDVDGVNLHPLRAPAEGVVGGEGSPVQ